MNEDAGHSQGCILLLPDEILIKILEACDVNDVLMIEKTCRTIYSLSDSKHLWLSRLAKLDYDHAPDIPPHVDLAALETKQVKRLISRAMRGYDNWASPGGPRMTGKRVINYGMKSGMETLMLLPGCEYTLVRSHHEYFLGLWSIEREEIVIKYSYDKISMPYSVHCAWLKGGTTARVAYSRDLDDMRTRFVAEVVDFDLVLEQATPVSSFEDVKVDCVFPMWMKVTGEFVLVWVLNRITVFDVRRARTAIVTQKGLIYTFDIVRDVLFCVFMDVNWARVYVVHISRIFECVQDKDSVPLQTICENIVDLPTMMNPKFGYKVSVSFCDPMLWGSSEPYRIIVFLYVNTHDEDLQEYQFHVQALRFYLREGTNGSHPELILDSSSRMLTMEGLESFLPLVEQPASGHSLIYDSKSSDGVLWRLSFPSSRLWEDTARLCVIEDRDLQPDLKYLASTKMELYSKTMWYRKQGAVVLCYYD